MADKDKETDQTSRIGSGKSSQTNTKKKTDKDSESTRDKYKSRASIFVGHIDISTEDEVLPEEIDSTNVPWVTSKRFMLALLCFAGFMMLYAQRVNLSIAIVCMTSPLVDEHANDTKAPDKCPAAKHGGSPCGDEPCELHWTKQQEGSVLAAFYYGYLMTQVVGGRMAEKFGAKIVIAIGMFPVAITQLLSPIVARLNVWAFFCLRVICGLGEGVMYPATAALWTNWAPPQERSVLIGISFAGGQFGNAMIFPVGGFLCAEGFDRGWASVFYVIGICGATWATAWVLLCYSSPAEHPRITESEKNYINQCLMARRKSTPKGEKVPWKAIFTSVPVWAIIIGHTCGNYGIYMCLSKIPSYMKDVLHFDLKSNGVMSMLPYLTFWVCITLGGIIADLLIKREILSVVWTRKLMTIIGTIIPALFLYLCSTVDCTRPYEAVAYLTLSVGFCGFHFSGYFINHGDIAPAYAGTLFGISNTAATIPGILSAEIVSAMTPDGTREQWQSTFLVACGVYCTGAIVFTIFGSGEIQPWAQLEDTENQGSLENAVKEENIDSETHLPPPPKAEAMPRI